MFKLYLSHEETQRWFSLLSGTPIVTALLGVTPTKALKSSGSSVPCPNVHKVAPPHIKHSTDQYINGCYVTHVCAPLCDLHQISTKNAREESGWLTGVRSPSLKVAPVVSRGTLRLSCTSPTTLGGLTPSKWAWAATATAGTKAGMKRMSWKHIK